MRLGIVGHVSIDELVFGDEELESIGGAVSYSGIISSRVGFKVIPVTKFGYDMKEKWLGWLRERGIDLNEGVRSRSSPTTRYRIVIKGAEREMYLKEKCEEIGEEALEFDADGAIVSPIARELDEHLVVRIPGEFRALDPQGILREFGPDGKVGLRSLDPSFMRGIDLVKVDLEEAKALTGFDGLDAVHSLLKLVGMVLLTDAPNGVYLLHEGGGYRLNVPKVEVRDTTGAGDLLLSSFVCSYLKDNDARWAFSEALSISALSLRGRGIEKVEWLEGFEELSEELHDSLRSLSI